MSLYKNIRSDVIYFDFAKAFDSVNYDLILLKLKTLFLIDGCLLQFIKAYLKDRKQDVVVGRSSSTFLPVLSGVPQGSILGPTLFVLFLNDITLGIDKDTNIVMYADDTKIWRQMDDHLHLQRDIDYLFDWALKNKMKFHASKCKVLMVSKFSPLLLDILPFVQFFYKMGDSILENTETEKDLGILMNRTFNFTDHSNFLYGRANQRFGLLKRTCHFVHSIEKRRVLYLTMVRSLFEHCPIIWRPSSDTAVNRLESFQMRAIKWILKDFSVSYSFNKLLYFTHCKQLNILPIQLRFDYHDLKFLHLVVHNFSCIKLPSYLRLFDGSSRLRSTHLDHFSLVSDIKPNGIKSFSSKRCFTHTFFYRAHLSWNRLPLTLRKIIRPSVFKSMLIKYIWEELTTIVLDSDDEHG